MLTFLVVIPIMFEKDEAKKKTLSERMKKEDFPAFMKNMAKALEDNGGQYLVGSGLTYADIGLATILYGVTKRFGGAWEKSAPKLAAYKDKIYSLPNIKKWVETRPEN
jgi:glutathione S-transferase